MESGTFGLAISEFPVRKVSLTLDETLCLLGYKYSFVDIFNLSL